MADPVETDDEDLIGDQDDDQEPDQDNDTPADGDTPEDEFVIEFEGEEAEPVPESSVIKQLRERVKELQARTPADPPAKPAEVGPKPTLEGCGYDEDKFDVEYEKWKTATAQAQAAQADANKGAEAAKASFAEDLGLFERNKAAIKVRDFDVAEATVDATLNQVQLAVVVKAANNSANVIYALGKHPGRLAQLAAIQDPIKLAAAVARMEGSLKVTTKRKAAEPEVTVRGSASLSAGGDKELEKMEREADRNPNYDRGQIRRYLRDKAAKSR